jgi:hypothetical protein
LQFIKVSEVQNGWFVKDFRSEDGKQTSKQNCWQSFMSSLRRYVTSDRADKGEDVTEGEKSMSWYAVHNLICKMLCKESGNGYLFANIFLTLE